jgi:hypothetical protein
MNQNRNTEEKLRAILKEDGLKKPSEQFSDQLTHSILQHYQKDKREEYTAERWLGKVILGILVSFNISFLLYLIPFSLQPALITSIVAFTVGLWGLIGLIKKAHASRIDSMT